MKEKKRNILNIGLPKGSLQESTLHLFRKAGFNINVGSRSYVPTIDDPELSGLLIRAQEMARYVQDGILDMGLTGRDWVLEQNAKVKEVCPLLYARGGLRPVRWVVAVPNDSPIQRIRDLHGKRVATELVQFTRRYLAERGVNATVEFSWGATEGKAAEGLVDAIVEITETGSTIRAHGLRIVCDLLHTHTRLVANRAALADPWKRAKIEQVALLLQAALNARHKVVLSMNVPAASLDAVVGLLPSLHAPTVNHLYDQAWVAVETVVDSRQVRDLIPRLRAAGAEGILEYALRKIVP